MARIRDGSVSNRLSPSGLNGNANGALAVHRSEAAVAAVAGLDTVVAIRWPKWSRSTCGIVCEINQIFEFMQVIVGESNINVGHIHMVNSTHRKHINRNFPLHPFKISSQQPYLLLIIDLFPSKLWFHSGGGGSFCVVF